MVKTKEADKLSATFSDILFLSFWAWEYARRSPKNVERIGELIDHQGMSTGTTLAVEGVGAVKAAPGRCLVPYLKSSDIIEDIISGVFNHKVDTTLIFPFGHERDVVPATKAISYWVKDEESRHMILKKLDEIERLGVGKFLFVPEDLDPQEAGMNLEVKILKEKVNVGPESDEDDQGFFTKAMLAHKKKLLSLHGFKRTPRLSSSTRAVGLWLWDYINENKCTQQDAINALGKEVDLRALGVEDVNNEDWRHYYRRTKKCIEQGKILSLSKRGT